jgi:hypothetical protein
MNLKNAIQTILKYCSEVKESSSTQKPGMILTILISYINIKLIPELNSSIEKFEEINNFNDTSFFNNQTKAHEIILFDLLLLLKRIKNLNDFIYYGYFANDE